MNGSGGMGAASDGGELDLREVGRALRRRKWWVIGPTLAVAIAATLTVNLLTPRYKSEARVLYDGRENVFLRPQAERTVTERIAADQEALASQVQLILSRELALQVIGELKLADSPEFDPLLKGISPLKRILVLIGFSRDPERMTVEERVLESYYERITAYTIDKSRVITIEFQSADPALAAKAVNAVAEGYLGLQQRAKQDDMRASSHWLAGEIDVLRRKVAEAEARAEEFRARTNLFVGTNNTTLSNQQLGESNSQLASARAQKSDAETRARLIRDMLRRGEPIEASEIVNSELVRRLSEQRVALRAQLAEQYSTLLDAHPRIKELKAQLNDYDRQIRAEAEKLVRTLENDAKIAGARVDALSASLDSLKKQAATNNEDDVRLRALEREARAQRELLESYLARFREASARENIASAPADARIISRGVVSHTPYFPKKLAIVLIATIATLVISAAFTAAGELMRANAPRALPATPTGVASSRTPLMQRLASQRLPGTSAEPAELEADAASASRVEAANAPGAKTANAPALAPAVPEAPLPEALFPGNAEGRRASPLASLEALADMLREPADSRRVAFFGLDGDEAAAAAALGVARLLARDGLIALVQAAGPGAPALAVDGKATGVTDLIAGKASFGEVIVRDRLSRAHVVPHGRLAMRPAEVLGSLRFLTMIDALARTYDLVIIDAGAVGALAPDKVAALAPRGVLVVANEADANGQKARAALEGAGYGDSLVLLRAPAAEPQPEAA